LFKNACARIQGTASIESISLTAAGPSNSRAMPEPERKKYNFFQVDQAAFRPLHKAKFQERYLVEPLKSLGRYVFFGALFAYPVALVIVGVEFGGLVFWSSFLGSVALIGLAIDKLGYSRNFQNWDVALGRIRGLLVAFLLVLGFYFGIIYLKVWLAPVTVIAAAVVVPIMLKKGKL
jgi:hypothetical protein